MTLFLFDSARLVKAYRAGRQSKKGPKTEPVSKHVLDLGLTAYRSFFQILARKKTQSYTLLMAPF